MAISSDDEDVITRRRSCAFSTGKKIFDSDDEDTLDNVDAVQSTTDLHEQHLSNSKSDKSSSESEGTLFQPHENELSQFGQTQGANVNFPGSCDSKEQNVSVNGDEVSTNNISVTQVHTFNKNFSVDSIKSKLNALADSDSESETENGSCAISGIKLSKSSVYSSKHKTTRDTKRTSKHKQEEGSSKALDTETDSGSDTNVEGPSSKKGSTVGRPIPERKSKNVAKNAMLEIKAQSQRRLRESNIGLPYHVPKERTLLDFLNRRKAPCIPIKGSADTLILAWKQIEEREKEVEDFYKSDSESDSDNESKGDQEGNLIGSLDANSKLHNTGSISSNGDPAKIVADYCSTEVSNALTDRIGVVGDENDALKEDMGPNIGLQSSSFLSGNVTPHQPHQAHPLNSEDIHLHLSETETIDLPADECMQSTCEENAQSVPEEEFSNPSVLEVVQRTSDERTERIQDSLGSLPQESSNFKSSEDFVLAIEDSETQMLKESEPVTNCESQTEEEEKDTGLNRLLLENAFAMCNSEDECEDVSQRFPKDSDRKFQITHTLQSAPRFSLKGAPDEVIDLDQINPATAKSSGVQSLMERFMKHSIHNPQLSSPKVVELSVIASEKCDGDIVSVVHESLKIAVSAREEGPCRDQTPGAKLKILKGELFRQMKRQKEEEWQKKQEELKMEQNEDGEKETCDGFLTDEEEEDMTEIETESEPEINDVREPKNRKRKKKIFVDEEAEVDDEGDSGDENEVEADNETDGKIRQELSSSDDDYDGDEEELNDDEEEEQNQDDLKDNDQGQKVNDDQSVGSTTSAVNEGGSKNSSFLKLQRNPTSADLFASQHSHNREGPGESDDDFDDLMTPGQRRPPDQEEANYGSFNFSPVNYGSLGKRLTTPQLESANISSKFVWSQGSSFSNRMRGLITEVDESSTQEKMNELIGLCSGKFNDADCSEPELAGQDETESQNDVTALSSGKSLSLEGEKDLPSFPAVPKGSSSLSSNLIEESQDYTLKLNIDDDSTALEPLKPTKSFELEFMSSDEEDAVSKNENRRKSRKLDFSDDDDSDTQAHSGHSSVESDVEDDAVEKEEEHGVRPEREIMYDSDENVIEADQFLDKEAELSEEEWEGSDDEDEAGLDQMEMNEADKEDIDQDKVREDIVKSHMQKILDEDRRDVRILQEMLLEDGELHSEGGGRERQFRWKNVDLSGMTNDLRNSDEENDDRVEDEEDAEWRKRRHEREMFLKQQREKQGQQGDENVEDDEIFQDSELLQLGKAVLLKSRSTSWESSTTKEPQALKIPVPNPVVSPDAKRPFQVFAKRGSFLSRKDGVLDKLAKVVGSVKENVSSGAKSRGNFVFAAVSPPKVDSTSKECEESNVKVLKRKALKSFSNSSVKKPCLFGSEKRSGLFDHL